ncbi:MAG: hydrolase family protein [Naasia sp.]|nr:hydrolase family protein [Naasia sp.]
MRRPLLSAAVAVVTAAALSLTACSSPVPGPPGGPGPLVAFYGDSYTLGTGASAENMRWSTNISGERGWREYNPSVNGLGFVNNRTRFGAASGDLPSLILAQEPDIVIVTMGLNDNFSYAARGDYIRKQIDADLERLSTGLPDARLVVVEPFWYTDDRPESVEVINGWVRDAAERIGADHIAGASRWTEGHPEWMAADGLHPNDAGYAELTRRMDAELSSLGL